MTIFFDNIIIFLNVLEQFAIRVTIFDVDVEDIIKYVNNFFWRNNDDYITNLLKSKSLESAALIDPYLIVKEANQALDKKIVNDILFEKLEYKYNIKNHFRFIY